MIIAGSCAKESYRKTLGFYTKYLEVLIQPGAIIRLELDFQKDIRLRRITIYANHPSAAFFSPKPDTLVCAYLEGSLNFALWLDGRLCRETHFTAGGERGIITGVPRAEPLAEMYFYVKLERESRQRFENNHYDPNFLVWAKQYLGEKPSQILTRGHSLAETVHRKICESMRARHKRPEFQARHAAKNHRLNEVRFGITYAECWHGREVRIRLNGRVLLFITNDRPALILVAGKSAYNLVQRSKHTPVIMFSKDGVSLKIGDQVVYRRVREALLRTKEGAD